MTAGLNSVRPVSPRARLGKLVAFLAAGAPAFGLALGLNYLLVDRFRAPAAPAYAIVLVAQVTLNYFMCRWFVFRAAGRRARWGEYGLFTGGILAFRAVDWLLYVFLVKGLGVYYLVAQGLNVVVFALAKFLFAERVLDRKTENR